jgi:hypothetical protein
MYMHIHVCIFVPQHVYTIFFFYSKNTHIYTCLYMFPQHVCVCHDDNNLQHLQHTHTHTYTRAQADYDKERQKT